MITIANIKAVLKSKLQAAYPTRTVYEDLSANDFTRPSFFLDLMKVKVEDVNRSTVEVQVGFQIVCFGAKDEYAITSSADLLITQQAVLNLFRADFIKVDDRALKPVAVEGEHNLEEAHVTVAFNFYDERSAWNDPDYKMQDVQLNSAVQEKE